MLTVRNSTFNTQSPNFAQLILHLLSSILHLPSSILYPLSSILHLPSSILKLLLIAGVLLVSACRQDMHDQPKYIPYRPVDQLGSITDGRSARPVVEGTVARGQLYEDVEFYTGRVEGFDGQRGTGTALSSAGPGRSRNRAIGFSNARRGYGSGIWCNSGSNPGTNGRRLNG
jgi:hypothetical protein